MERGAEKKTERYREGRKSEGDLGEAKGEGEGEGEGL
jgi:hypothetical protein